MEDVKEVKKKAVVPKTVSAQDFIDAIKPLNLAVATDKHNRITVRKDTNVLTYLSDRKKGFSYSVKDPSIKWGWKSVLITTADEMKKKVEELKELAE